MSIQSGPFCDEKVVLFGVTNPFSIPLPAEKSTVWPRSIAAFCAALSEPE